MPKIPPAELLAEIHRTEEFRYVHRLHGVLLMASGMTYDATANVLGTSVRSLKYWVSWYRESGFAGLRERIVPPLGTGESSYPADRFTALLGPKIPTEELEREIRRTERLRYAHRLHGMLLLANGLSYAQAAKALGTSLRALKYWARSFRESGLVGLHEGKGTGRRRRLNDTQLRELTNAIQQPPSRVGLAARQWTARLLSEWIQERYSIALGVRQCKRLLPAMRRSLDPAHTG